MKARTAAVVVALLQAAIVLAVGGKLLFDRATLPRVWVETAGVDPYLPIRGRYASLRLVVMPVNPPDEVWLRQQRAIGPRQRSMPIGRIIPADDGLQVELLLDEAGKTPFDRAASMYAQRDVADAQGPWTLSSPVAFFLPEHVDDPTRLAADTQLWAEVTVPRNGPPRPIRLALKRQGQLEPL